MLTVNKPNKSLQVDAESLIISEVQYFILIRMSSIT